MLFRSSVVVPELPVGTGATPPPAADAALYLHRDDTIIGIAEQTDIPVFSFREHAKLPACDVLVVACFNQLIPRAVRTAGNLTHCWLRQAVRYCWTLLRAAISQPLHKLGRQACRVGRPQQTGSCRVSGRCCAHLTLYGAPMIGAVFTLWLLPRDAWQCGGGRGAGG